MKVYSEKDLENFERDEYGFLVCPSGDYTQIKSFDAHCRFGKHCRFGEYCSFGEYCCFGDCCRFGKHCRFGEYCSFGEYCRFGKHCRFGDCCRFGECSRFGEYCRFGEGCGLENNLKFENIEDKVDRVLKIDRIGSRKSCTYFFKTVNEIYVRCGCFFGTITEFKNEVNKTHANNKQYRKEYIGAIRYVKEVLRG